MGTITMKRKCLFDFFKKPFKEDNLGKLEELTSKLPDFPPGEPYHGGISYSMDKGTCFAWDIRTTKFIQITRWENSKGTRFPLHSHKEKEWTILYKGKVTIKYMNNGKIRQKTIEAGEGVYHEPNMKHSAVFLEDSEYITIMIPPSKDYPKGW